MQHSGTPHVNNAATYRPYAFHPPANPMGNKLSADFGNPGLDSRVFQIDSTYQRFIDNYDTVRHSGHFVEYVAEDQLDPAVRTAVCAFIVDTLGNEYPDHFQSKRIDDGIALKNALLNESIQLDSDYNYAGGGRSTYRDGLDALAAQIPEDLAIVEVKGNTDRLAAVHVVAPSGWAPREKLGGSFVEVHHPIEHHRAWLEKVQAGVRNMAKSDRPLQRFGWSLTNDDKLNHHPEYCGPSGDSRVSSDHDLFVRVERQVLKGFPEHSALLFTIRVYVERCVDLPAKDRAALTDAVRAMGPEERAYKGVSGDFDRIVRQLGD